MIFGGATTILLQTHKLKLSEKLNQVELAETLDKIKTIFPDIQNISTEALNKNELIAKIDSLQLIHSDLFNLSFQLPFRLDANIFGILLSAVIYLLISKILRVKRIIDN